MVEPALMFSLLVLPQAVSRHVMSTTGSSLQALGRARAVGSSFKGFVSLGWASVGPAGVLQIKRRRGTTSASRLQQIHILQPAGWLKITGGTPDYWALLGSTLTP